MTFFVLGRSGSGKSEYILSLINKNVQNGEKAFVIMPEQEAADSERAIIERCGNKANLSVEVLNFSRLADRVFRETGGFSGRYVEEPGRAVMMKLALKKVEDNLTYYKKKGNCKFFSEKVLQQIDEFKRCGVTPAELFRVSESETMARPEKIRDIATIYASFESLFEGELKDKEATLIRLSEALKENDFFKDSYVYIDGFYDFTGVQYNVIRGILSSAKEVYISLPYDNGEASDLFLKSAVALNKIEKILKDQNKASKRIVLTENRRTRKPDLQILEKYVWSGTSPREKIASENITVLESVDIYSECELAAKKIKKLKAKGAKNSEIAVIMRNPDDYDGILDMIFEKYALPCFFSRKNDLLSRPIVTMVLSALELVSESFRLPTLLRYIKTGLSGISENDSYILENYLQMWAPSAALLRENCDFDMSPSGYRTEFSEEDREKLKKINELRRFVFTPVINLLNNMKNKNATEKCNALFDFLEEVGAKTAIERKAEELRSKGDYSGANEEIQIWNCIISSLEQIMLVLKDSSLSSKDFEEYLYLALSQYKTGKLPTDTDSVEIGEAGFTRSGGKKYLFVLGLVDGVFPAAGSSDRLISDFERERLKENGIELPGNALDRASGEMFVFYNAVASPSEHLYLSYYTSKQSSESSQCKKSIAVFRVEGLFSDIGLIRDKDYKEDISSKDDAVFYLASHYYDDNEAGQKIREYAEGGSEASEKLRNIVNAVKFRDEPPTLNIDNNRGNVNLTYSRLEKYVECRYSYFLRYMLGAKAERRAKFDAPVIGDFVHRILENYFKVLRSRNTDFSSVTKEESEKLLEEMILEYIDDSALNIDKRSPRFVYLFSRLKRTLSTLVSNMMNELKNSGFKPVFFETEMGSPELPAYEIPLDGGGSLTIYGKADRADLYISPKGKKYIRIIDYKTALSGKNFSLEDVYNGLSMQLLIYLFAFCKNGAILDNEKILPSPAGVLYLKSSISAETIDADNGEEVLKNVEKGFVRRGLFIDDKEVCEAMEPELLGTFFPITIDKNGEVSPKKTLATYEQFGKLMRFAEKTFAAIAEEIRSGKIEINPFCDRNTSCIYCEYKPICRNRGRDSTRIYEKIPKGKDFWELIEE